eukprot:SAG11_NODE_6284_length_1344_cov_1.185542_3_plen_53_part_00
MRPPNSTFAHLLAPNHCAVHDQLMCQCCRFEAEAASEMRFEREHKKTGPGSA